MNFGPFSINLEAKEILVLNTILLVLLDEINLLNILKNDIIEI